MRIYNVNVYDINQYFKVESNKFVSIKKIDKIIVVKNLFGVHELITNQPLIIYNDNYFIEKRHIKYFLKYEFFIGINKKDLIDKNMVTAKELDKYGDMFVWSRFREFVRDRSTQEQINYKIKKISKKIK